MRGWHVKQNKSEEESNTKRSQLLCRVETHIAITQTIANEINTWILTKKLRFPRMGRVD